MKKLLILIPLIFFCSSFCFADDIPISILSRYKQIVNLVRQHKASELALLIEYPLKRENPFPPRASFRSCLAHQATLLAYR
ncbi:MAG: hypothetical protein FDX21_10930 [Chlorobium sp.]|nr:MAG: hypothetical protein FDX21_10930 [Chlorobium sp.]